MFEKLIATLGDKLYLLRESLDRDRRAIAEVPPPEPDSRHRRPPFDWSRLKKPSELRRVINEYATQVSVGAIAFLVALGTAAACIAGRTNRTPPGSSYFLDLTTNKLFTAAADQVPPIKTPGRHMRDGQPAGVRAYVMSCGDCADTQSHMIAYLESFTSEGQRVMLEAAGEMAILRNASDSPPQSRETGCLVARADLQGGWIPASSQEGRRLVSDAMRPCPGTGNRPRSCRP